MAFPVNQKTATILNTTWGQVGFAAGGKNISSLWITKQQESQRGVKRGKGNNNLQINL